MSQRIEMERVELPSGVQGVVRGAGNIVDGEFAHIWLEQGLLWVQPKANNSAAKVLRCYHPSNCTMYPKPGQASIPAVPGEEKLQAVAGGKR